MDNLFTTRFWKERAEEDAKYPPHTAVITDNYEHYVIDDEDSKDPFRGFGGAKVTITFKDGTVIHSTNLWYQGEIDNEFRYLFTPNARIEWN